MYGFVWPVWMVRTTEHWSTKNFTELPSNLTGTVSDAQEVFVILIKNLYAAASATTNPLTEFWTKAALIPAPVLSGRKKKTKNDKELESEYNRQRVLAVAAALKNFWATICGQSVDEMKAPLLSIQAIMDGTNVRLKEVRPIEPVPHVWKIYANDPAPLLPPPNPAPSPPPGGPTVPAPSTSSKSKRKSTEDSLGDTPVQQSKKIKAITGALTQKDDELLDLDVDSVIDCDDEGGYAPGLAVPDSASVSGASYVSEDDGDDDEGSENEEMPDVQVKQSDEKFLVHSAIAPDNAAETSNNSSNFPTHPPSSTNIPIRTSASLVASKPLPNPAKSSTESSQNPSAKVETWLQGHSAVALPLAASAPSDTLITVSNSPFYLCGSDFPAFSPDSTQAPLESGSFSDWVATLDNGYVALANGFVQPQTSPDSATPPPQVVAANIHANDEWFQRISNNGLGITQIVFHGYIDTASSVAHVSSLEADLQIPLSPQSGVETLNLTFSSDASKTVSLGATTASTLPTLGDAVTLDYTLLSLGLQSSNPAQLTVGQIVSYFGMSYFPTTSDGGFALPGFNSISTLTAALDTGPGSRSSLTFKPDVMYSAWLRLRFLIQDSNFANTFLTNFSFLSDITLNNTAIVALKKANCQSGFVGRQVTTGCTLETQITLGGNFMRMSMFVWVVFDYAQTKFIINFDSDTEWSQIKGWLAGVLGISGTDSDSLDPTGLLPNSSNVNFDVRQVTLALGNPGPSSGFSVLGASITFEVTAYKTIFSLTLNWPGPSISARLWTEIAPDVSQYALLPYIEPYSQYTPLGTPIGQVNFSDFSDNSIPPPPPAMNLSPTFYELGLTASWDLNKNLQYKFTGSLQSLPLSSNPAVPKVVLGDLDFALSSSSVSGLNFSLTTSIYLVPRDYPDTLASLLEVSVEYVDKGLSSAWQIIGSATGISFATLYNLFDSDSNDAVMDILGSFSILELEVVWDYSSSEADLFVNGILRIGPFELDLTYQYLHSPVQGQNAWTFGASLGSYSSGEYTLGTLIEDLGVDQAVLDAIADVPFVNNLTIPSAVPSPGSTPPVALSISKEPNAETVFWLQIAINTSEGTLSFTYVQLQAARSAGTPTTDDDDDGNSSTTPTGFKRIIRVMLDRLPMLPSVPIVGQIEEPVDAIDYIWVGDSTVNNSTSTAGLKFSDISLINSTMSAGNQIPYKSTQSRLQGTSPGNATSAAQDPYVLLSGHHFLVQANGGVIIDHMFGQSTPPSPSPGPVSRFTATPSKITGATTTNISPKTAKAKKQLKTKRAGPKSLTFSRAASVTPPTPPTATTADSGSTKAPLSKAVGPLNIHNVSILVRTLVRILKLPDWIANQEWLPLYSNRCYCCSWSNSVNSCWRKLKPPYLCQSLTCILVWRWSTLGRF